MVNNIILNNSINNVKLGDNQILKIFKGIDLVWSTSMPIAPSLYTGLIANYKLDETSGTTAIDETGNHNGIINGTPTLGVASNLGNGYNFNYNAANFVDLQTRDLIGGKAAFTIATWINSSNGDYYGAWTGSRIASFSFNVRPINYIYIGGAIKGGGFDSPFQGAWEGTEYVLILVKYDGVTLKTKVNNIFSNDSYAASGSVQAPVDCQTERIGSNGRSSCGSTISSLQIWNRATTNEEDTNLWNGGSGIIL